MADHPRHRFTKDQKLRRGSDFKRVYDASQKAGDGFLLLFALPNETGVTRLGLSVSKKHGSAVRRNKIKRRLREAFRLSQHDLPPNLDLIAIPRIGVGASVEEFQHSMVSLSSKIAQRLQVASANRTVRNSNPEKPPG